MFFPLGKTAFSAERGKKKVTNDSRLKSNITVIYPSNV